MKKFIWIVPCFIVMYTLSTINADNKSNKDLNRFENELSLSKIQKSKIKELLDKDKNENIISFKSSNKKLESEIEKILTEEQKVKFSVIKTKKYKTDYNFNIE